MRVSLRLVSLSTLDVFKFVLLMNSMTEFLAVLSLLSRSILVWSISLQVLVYLSFLKSPVNATCLLCSWALGTWAVFDLLSTFVIV